MQPPDTGEEANAAQGTLYERFAVPLLDYLCQQVSQRQDAEDLLFEVFLAALQNGSLADLSIARQLAWLRRVARNKVIDYYRHTALLTWQPLEQTPELADQDSTLETHVEEQEALIRLSQAIEQLSPAQRELIHLRYMQELRLTQIATLLEKSEGTVRKMLSRTLHRLKTLYEQPERREHHE